MMEPSKRFGVESFASPEEALRAFAIPGEGNLYELSFRQPLLLVFLRHGGCIFCREALLDLARQEREIAARGARLLIVQMGSRVPKEQLAQSVGVPGEAILSDPGRRLYRAFGLGRVRWWEMLRPAVLRRAWTAWRKGVRPGLPAGDTGQLPGAFLVEKGRVVKAFRPRSLAEEADFIALAAVSDEGGPML
ncbi:MAG: peroxiredoxin-like family protein [Acidobacteriota bacterium]